MLISYPGLLRKKLVIARAVHGAPGLRSVKPGGFLSCIANRFFSFKGCLASFSCNARGLPPPHCGLLGSLLDVSRELRIIREDLSQVRDLVYLRKRSPDQLWLRLQRSLLRIKNNDLALGGVRKKSSLQIELLNRIQRELDLFFMLYEQRHIISEI